jgi:hypothetical protein
LKNFKRGVESNPKARALLEAYPETLGNNAALIVAIANSVARKQQGRR